jgi:acetyl-CoA synthetase
MLASYKTHDEAVGAFRWDLPEQFNMAWEVCDKWAEKDPDRTAVIDLSSGKRLDVTFSELKQLSDKLALFLSQSGIVPGDRIGVLRPQSVWTAAAHIAIWKLGAISMPLFALFGEEALSSRLENSGACAVITDETQANKHDLLFSGIKKLKHVVVPETVLEGSQVTEFTMAGTGPDTPACLIYTSGTTGSPKGALHGHRILPGHLPGVEMSHDLFPQSGDVLWTPADWAWIGGLFDVLMPGLFHGIPVVAARMEKFSAERCREIIRDGGVRNIFFPPTALRMLKAEDMRLPGLRTVACGGEPLGAEMLAWGREALGVTINEFYGQTECNMTVSSCNAWFEPRPGSIGKPVPGHEVAVIDDQGNPAGEEGDIAVRRGSAAMMLEYWENPQATREKFRGDWLLTGDRGVMEGGYIRFVGRDDDVITSAGYRIGPAEIEDCLLKHEAVASVGVIGKPDRERTEIVKAYVLLRQGYEPSGALSADLQEHVKTRLAAYEYPREIEFVDSLPMTVTGKIIRKELKARAIREMEEA